MTGSSRHRETAVPLHPAITMRSPHLMGWVFQPRGSRWHGKCDIHGRVSIQRLSENEAAMRKLFETVGAQWKLPGLPAGTNQGHALEVPRVDGSERSGPGLPGSYIREKAD